MGGSSIVFKKLGIRHAALYYANMVKDHDTFTKQRTRQELREGLYEYLMQECSAIIEDHLKSPEGSMTLDGVEKIYNRKPSRSARLGTSGYHK
jgi:hypothetical protein